MGLYDEESPGVTWSHLEWGDLTILDTLLQSGQRWNMTIVTDTSSPGLPHTCKGWGGDSRGRYSYVDKDTNKYLFLPWKK